VTTEKYFDEDSILAEKAERGDRTAFSALVEKYQGPIYGYALHFFRNPESAADVAQDTFLRAYRFLHTYDSSRRFATWLYSIARNLCIDRHREQRRHEQIGLEPISGADEARSHERSPLTILESREDRARLSEAIRELPEKYRTPVVLCYFQGLSYQEISEILGISLNNTKIRIFRAKKQLLRALDLFGDEP